MKKCILGKNKYIKQRLSKWIIFKYDPIISYKNTIWMMIQREKINPNKLKKTKKKTTEPLNKNI